MCRCRSPVEALVLLVSLSLLPAGRSPCADDSFVRGDVDGSGAANITDAVQVLRHLFRGSPGGLTCLDAADVDDSGGVLLTDAVFLLNYLFRMGEPPPFPFPDCGRDLSEDELTCKDWPGTCETTSGVYFVIDRSDVAGQEALDTAKREVAEAVKQLSAGTEFAVVSYDRQVNRFPQNGLPARATPDNIEEALAWIDGLVAGRGSCFREAFLDGVRISQRHDAGRKVMIYFGVGSARCAGNNPDTYRAQSLEQVTDLNGGEVEIDCFGISPLAAADEAFLMELAARNLGDYTRL